MPVRAEELPCDLEDLSLGLDDSGAAQNPENFSLTADASSGKPITAPAKR